MRLEKPKSDADKRYFNRKTRTKVQTKRLENYADTLLQILNDYAEEIESSITAYNRKSCEETMMINGIRKSSQQTTNRKTHMENVEGIAVEIAKKLGLNIGVTRIMARNHDIGHTFLGHMGEWWLSNAKEDLGMGYYTHNALGPSELIYGKNIYNEILERIKEFNPQITEAETVRISKSLWLIFDGINSHNGEKTETEFRPDPEKDERKFQEEIKRCFIEKGFDKTIMPATFEGCLIRLCDKISYIPYDLLDGIREGMIDGLDSEYVEVLANVGITADEINNCNLRRNYDSIARRLQIIFTKDVIENSGNGAIRMSPEVSKVMHELRNLNNKKIVNFNILREDYEVYTPAIKKLMGEFSKILLEGDNLERLRNASANAEFADDIISKYEGTPYQGFAEYISGIRQTDYDFTEDIIYAGTKQSVKEEQKKAREIVKKGKKLEKEEASPNKEARIARYVEYYMEKEGILEEYTEEEIERDIEEEIARQEKGEGTYPSIREKMALEFGAKYLATLNDIEFFNLVKNAGLMTEKQKERLTRSYKEIGQEGLRREVHVQAEWKKLQQEQKEETEKIVSTKTTQEESKKTENNIGEDMEL